MLRLQNPLLWYDTIFDLTKHGKEQKHHLKILHEYAENVSEGYLFGVFQNSNNFYFRLLQNGWKISTRFSIKMSEELLFWISC
jgi:hypothetical protein